MSVANRPRLGRGLKSLISSPVMVNAPSSPPAAHEMASTSANEMLVQAEISLIDANPHQPRATMDSGALKELAASIKVSGVLQPVILRPIEGGRYQLVAGHRRTEAAKAAGLTTVPAIVRSDSTDERQAEWALVENIQREDLNAIERAKAYRAYVNKFNLTHAQAAAKLGEDRTTITNFLRLLDLAPFVQQLVGSGTLSAGHAKVLAGVADLERQEIFAKQVVAEGLSVRGLEKWVNDPPAELEPVTMVVAGHTRTLVAKSPHVVELEQDLSRKLGTKLRIFPSKKKNTGKMVIQYFSLDEFDRIIEKFN